jgi:hypothetical protein
MRTSKLVEVPGCLTPHANGRHFSISVLQWLELRTAANFDELSLPWGLVLRSRALQTWTSCHSLGDLCWAACCNAGWLVTPWGISALQLHNCVLQAAVSCHILWFTHTISWFKLFKLQLIPPMSLLCQCPKCAISQITNSNGEVQNGQFLACRTFLINQRTNQSEKVTYDSNSNLQKTTSEPETKIDLSTYSTKESADDKELPNYLRTTLPSKFFEMVLTWTNYKLMHIDSHQIWWAIFLLGWIYTVASA